jgi:hypothetical protein
VFGHRDWLPTHAARLHLALASWGLVLFLVVAIKRCRHAQLY